MLYDKIANADKKFAMDFIGCRKWLEMAFLHF